MLPTKAEAEQQVLHSQLLVNEARENRRLLNELRDNALTNDAIPTRFVDEITELRVNADARLRESEEIRDEMVDWYGVALRLIPNWT